MSNTCFLNGQFYFIKITWNDSLSNICSHLVNILLNHWLNIAKKANVVIQSILKIQLYPLVSDIRSLKNFDTVTKV